MTRLIRNTAAALVVFALALASAPPSYADTSASANRGVIDRFYVEKEGRLFINLRNPGPRAADCKDGWYAAPANHPQRSLMHAGVLAAWLAALPVSIRVSDGHRDGEFCDIQFVLFDR